MYGVFTKCAISFDRVHDTHCPVFITNADRRFYIMLIVPPNAYKMFVILKIIFKVNSL